MNSLDLFELIGKLDIKLVADGIEQKPRRKISASLTKAFAAAACIALVIVGAVVAILNLGGGNGNFEIEGGTLIAYRGNETNVIIPDSVVTISNYAFSESGNASKIETITLGKRTANIEPYAFYGCTSLTHVSAHKNGELQETDGAILSDDGTHFAYFNSNEKSISYTIPDGVKSVGSYAFVNSNIHELTLPESVTKLYKSAVIFNDSLESLKLLGLKKISAGAFENNISLKSVTAPKAEQIEESAFAGCRALTSLTLPNVQYIGDGAFAECTSLEKLTFASVKEIGANAFYGCSSLHTLEIPSVEVLGYGFITKTEVRALKLNNILKLDDGTFPHKMAIWGNVGDTAQKFVTQSQSSAISHIFVSIDTNVLLENYTLTCLLGKTILSGATVFTSPDENGGAIDTLINTDVTCIAYNSEWYMIIYAEGYAYVKKDEVIVEANNTSAPSNVYGSFAYEIISDGIRITEYMGSSTDIVIPQEIDGLPVVEIASGAFLYSPSANNIRSISSPSVKRVGEYLMSQTYALEIFSMPSLEEIPDGFFFNCLKLQSVEITSVVKIGAKAFENCNFTELYIPSATQIDEHALYASNIRTIHAYENSAAQSFAAANGLGFVDLKNDYVPTYSDTATSPESLTYSIITSSNEQYGFSGVSYAYDRYGKLYLYVSAWDKYFAMPIYQAGAAHRLCAAGIYGDVGFAAAVAGTDNVTDKIKVLIFKKDSASIETYTINLTSDTLINKLFVSFYDEQNGAIFVSTGEQRYRISYFSTQDGGETWSEHGTDIVSADYHSNPVTAKFADGSVGIAAFRYKMVEDLCYRTYITTDGGTTWSLIASLPYPDGITIDMGTEAVDLQKQGGKYILTVKVYDGLGGYYIEFTSLDGNEWSLSK